MSIAYRWEGRPTGQPVDKNRITMVNYEALHPGRSPVPPDVADQEFDDGIFDRSKSETRVKKVCEELLSKPRDQIDFNKCFHKSVIKKFQHKGRCF